MCSLGTPNQLGHMKFIKIQIILYATMHRNMAKNRENMFIHKRKMNAVTSPLDEWENARILQ